MGLQERPLKSGLMIQLYEKLKQKLDARKNLSLHRTPHDEMWLVKGEVWIGVSVRDIGYPSMPGAHFFDIRCMIPEEIWEDEKYQPIRDLMKDEERSFVVSGEISKVLSKYAHTEGVAIRDDEKGIVDRNVMSILLKINSHVAYLLENKQTILTDLRKCFDDILKNFL